MCVRACVRACVCVCVKKELQCEYYFKYEEFERKRGKLKLRRVIWLEGKRIDEKEGWHGD